MTTIEEYQKQRVEAATEECRMQVNRLLPPDAKGKKRYQYAAEKALKAADAVPLPNEEEIVSIMAETWAAHPSFSAVFQAIRPMIVGLVRNGEWQPIETAPKDGTEVLLLTPIKWGKMSLDKKEPRIGVGQYNAGAFWWNTEREYWQSRVGSFLLNPTHWMPLPPAPAVGGGESCK